MKDRITQAYQRLSVIITNAIAMFIVLNAFLLLIYGVHDTIYANPAARRVSASSERWLAVHPGWSLEDLQQLEAETYRPFVCDRILPFREMPFSGVFVNVTETGYRCNEECAPWPLEEDRTNVFAFGGSTMFGYRLGDGETIAAQVEAKLRAMGIDAVVYNFGCGFCTSVHGRLILEKLALQGIVPDIVLFFDGLNDFSQPAGHPTGYDPGRCQPEGYREPFLFPFQRLANDFTGRAQASSPYELPAGDATVYQSVIDRHMTNREMVKSICEQFDIDCYFIWQPIPYYKYDESNHLFFSDHNAEYHRLGYQMFAEMRDVWGEWDDFLYLADLLEDYDRPAFVDAAHYTSEVNEMIAVRIAEFISE